MFDKTIAGWDPGRLNNKLYLEDGKKFLNMNAICSGYERRVLEEENGDAINLLDVEVYRNNILLGRYFVGGMAYQYNRGDLRWSANGIPKFQDADTGNDEIVKLVSHLALSKHEEGKEVTGYFRLGTGAPTEEYFQEPQLLYRFSEALKDEYKVVFKHPIFKGASVKVRIPQVHFKPEGTASIISMSYTDSLEANKSIKEQLKKGYIFGINIGSSTTDAAIMNSKMQFESKGFFGLPVGSSNPLNEIRGKLYKEYGYDIPKVKLDFLIRNYPRVKYKGNVIELVDMVKEPYKNMVALLKTKFYDQMEMKGIDIGEAGAFLVSGGTALLVEKELQNFIPGVPTIISQDPLFEDARGYFLEAKYYEGEEKSKESKVYSGDKDIEVL